MPLVRAGKATVAARWRHLGLHGRGPLHQEQEGHGQARGESQGKQGQVAKREVGEKEILRAKL